MPEIQTMTNTGTNSVTDAIQVAVMNNDMKHFSDTLVRIEGKFDKAIQGFVPLERLAAHESADNMKHVEQDRAIKKLEDWNRWAMKIVLGAVIAAVLGIVIVKTNNLF